MLDVGHNSAVQFNNNSYKASFWIQSPTVYNQTWEMSCVCACQSGLWLSPETFLQSLFEFRQQRSEVLQLSDTCGDSSESVEQRHNFLPTELKWWIGVACVGHGLYLPFWKQDFQCCSQALGLQFSPKSAFKAFDTVHDARDVLEGELKVFLQFHGFLVISSK